MPLHKTVPQRPPASPFIPPIASSFSHLRSLNIGTVWCGLHPIEDRARPFREIFHMPENIRPLSLIVLGHTDQEFKAQERFRAERVHNEDW